MKNTFKLQVHSSINIGTRRGGISNKGSRGFKLQVHSSINIGTRRGGISNKGSRGFARGEEGIRGINHKGSRGFARGRDSNYNGGSN